MNNSVDLTTLMGDTLLNIRAVILLKTSLGFVFEKSKFGYLFPLGGRIKINESSKEAAIRELKEEMGVTDVDLNMIAIIENFFVNEMQQKVHEINFVYSGYIDIVPDLINLRSESENNDGYKCVMEENLEKEQIKPLAVVDIIKNKKPFDSLLFRG